MALYHSISDYVTETGVEKREFYGWERFWPRSRLDRLVSARVCPAQTLFLQIEPRVPPFTLYPSLLSVHFYPSSLRSLCPSSPFLSFLLSLLPSHILHLWIHTPLRTHATGARLVNYNKKASSFRRFAHDWLRCLIKEFIRHRNPRRFRRLDVRSHSGCSRVRSG